MFRITHGQNAGQIVKTEDEALELLTPEDLAAGGYVVEGELPHQEGCQDSPGYKSPVNPGGFASMINDVRRGS